MFNPLSRFSLDLASIPPRIFGAKWTFKKITRFATFLLIAFACGGCGKSNTPLKVTFRGSALDQSGLVLQVQNITDKHLSCRMDVTNATQKLNATYPFDLGPYQKTEIGVLECLWSFKTGETVRIGTEGFMDLKFNVP